MNQKTRVVDSKLRGNEGKWDSKKRKMRKNEIIFALQTEKSLENQALSIRNNIGIFQILEEQIDVSIRSLQ